MSTPLIAHVHYPDGTVEHVAVTGPSADPATGHPTVTTIYRPGPKPNSGRWEPVTINSGFEIDIFMRGGGSAEVRVTKGECPCAHCKLRVAHEPPVQLPGEHPG